MDFIIYGFSVDLSDLSLGVDFKLNDNTVQPADKIREYNKKLYSSAENYLFGDNGLLNKSFAQFTKIYKNGFLYIGYDVLPSVSCIGIDLREYCFDDLLPLINNISDPKLFGIF